MNEFYDREQIIVLELNCKHVFHYCCLEKRLRKLESNTCPYCKKLLDVNIENE